jgi:hypothetical protein
VCALVHAAEITVACFGDCCMGFSIFDFFRHTLIDLTVRDQIVKFPSTTFKSFEEHEIFPLALTGCCFTSELHKSRTPQHNASITIHKSYFFYFRLKVENKSLCANYESVTQKWLLKYINNAIILLS